MKKSLIVLIAIIASVIVGAVGGWELKSNIEPIAVSIGIADSASPVSVPAPSDRAMERELIRYDIYESGDRIGLSPRQQREYLEYLEEAADRYELPMILLHTVAYVESSYDPSAIHPQIIVKGKPTRAIGLTGIVWEYNRDLLIRENIATSRLELTEPRINLLASAAIIHVNVAQILAKDANVSVDKFFDELIRKYYGAYDETYKSRMLTKMKDIASRQWIRRTVKTIIISRTQPEEVVVADTVSTK